MTLRDTGAPWVALPAAALAVVLVAGALVENAAHAGDAAAALPDLAVAAAFVGGGATVWRSGLTGPLLVATGATWLVGSVSDDLALLHRGPLVQLLVAAPSGGRARGSNGSPSAAATWARSCAMSASPSRSRSSWPR